MTGAGAACSHDALGNGLVYDKRKKKDDQDHLPVHITEVTAFKSVACFQFLV